MTRTEAIKKLMDDGWGLPSATMFADIIQSGITADPEPPSVLDTPLQSGDRVFYKYKADDKEVDLG